MHQKTTPNADGQEGEISKPVLADLVAQFGDSEEFCLHSQDRIVCLRKNVALTRKPDGWHYGCLPWGYKTPTESYANRRADWARYSAALGQEHPFDGCATVLMLLWCLATSGAIIAIVWTITRVGL